MISQQDTREPESALLPEGCKPAAFLNKWALNVCHSQLSEHLTNPQCMWTG